MPRPQPTRCDAMRSVWSRGMSVSKETTCKLHTQCVTRKVPELLMILYLFMGETAKSSRCMAGLQVAGKEEMRELGLSYSNRAE